jgi:cytochrome oxidase Cu insertion factor (SCO1/SenC/PrrC family)
MRRRLTHHLILAALLAFSLPAAAAEEAPGEEIGPAVGTEAPQLTLQSVDGREVSLSDFRGESPVVLVFFRGEW